MAAFFTRYLPSLFVKIEISAEFIFASSVIILYELLTLNLKDSVPRWRGIFGPGIRQAVPLQFL